MNPRRRFNAADEPLWLVVQQEDCTKCFEFSPNNRRAIIIGSAETADIRVNDAAPIAGFLERDGASLWFIPADPNADISVDTIKANEKRRIFTHGLLELGGVELRLKVRDSPPTLRGDGLVRLDSEICQPRFSREGPVVDGFSATSVIDVQRLHAALGQETATTRSFERVVPGAILSTKTVEMGPIDFDGWFDAAVGSVSEYTNHAEGPESDAAPATPIIACGPDAGDTPKTAVAEHSGLEARELAACGPRPEYQGTAVSADAHSIASDNGTDISSTVTSRDSEMHSAPARVEGTKRNRPMLTQRLDPYQTIEISRPRLAEPSATASHTIHEIAPACSVATNPNKISNLNGDTTEFEVQIANPPPTKVPEKGDGIGRCATTGALSPNSAPCAAVDGMLASHSESDARRPLPLTPEHFERAARAAEAHERRRPSPTEALAKLGLLARRQPVLVFGGASIGSIILVMFLLAVAHLLGPRTNRNANQLGRPAASTSASVTTPASDQNSGKPSASREQSPNEASPVTPVVASAMSDASVPNAVPSAIASPPDVTAAVGHLFAGRLPEAEQAYRDLSSRFPSDQAFRAATRMLARRNSPACRPDVATTISCPAVKP